MHRQRLQYRGPGCDPAVPHRQGNAPGLHKNRRQRQCADPAFLPGMRLAALHLVTAASGVLLPESRVSRRSGDRKAGASELDPLARPVGCNRPGIAGISSELFPDRVGSPAEHRFPPIATGGHSPARLSVCLSSNFNIVIPGRGRSPRARNSGTRSSKVLEMPVFVDSRLRLELVLGPAAGRTRGGGPGITVLSVALELRRYPLLPADELPAARRAGGAGFVELNPPLRAANLRTCCGDGGSGPNRTARSQATPMRQARVLLSW